MNTPGYSIPRYTVAQMRSSRDVRNILASYLANVDREHFVVLLLDQKNKVIGIHPSAIPLPYKALFEYCTVKEKENLRSNADSGSSFFVDSPAVHLLL